MVKKAKCSHTRCRQIATVLMAPPLERPLSRTPLCVAHVEQFERVRGLRVLAQCDKGFEIQREKGYDRGDLAGLTYIACDGSGRRY